jgi:3-oxoacyl-[acyl-carrier protein] reductase
MSDRALVVDATRPALGAHGGADLGLRGKVAVVTGGGSGIGRGIAEALGRGGARVVLTYHDSAAGAEAALAAIAAAGAEGRALRADLTQEDEAAGVVEAAISAFGQVDILVANSGGLLERSRVADCPLDLWNRALAVNLTSTFLSCRAVLPHMERAGSGAIVTISSLAAHDGGGLGATHYATAKAGVITFTKALAKEVGPLGIRVNSVAPGLIGTQFHDRFSTPDGRKAVVGRTPLAREGTPTDVANAVLFLASPLAAFITGETVEVNGGQGVF